MTHKYRLNGLFAIQDENLVLQTIAKAKDLRDLGSLVCTQKQKAPLSQ